MLSHPPPHSVQAGPRRTNIRPHTVEAGDPYYIGDVYKNVSSSDHFQPWEIHDKSSMPYLAHIKSLAKGWPHLRYLADWMEVTMTPIMWKYLNAEERSERARRTRVAILDFDPEKETKRTDICSSVQLNEELQKPDTGPDNLHARLFVVEDLSRDVIEALGARFDIDPLFFRGHISDYLWYNTRDPWVELSDLELVARHRSFFHVQYVHARYFRSSQSLDRANEQANFFNVLRRLDGDRNHKTVLDEQGSSVAFVRSKSSLWIRPNKDHESGVVGVLLVDPTITEGYPLWGGYRTFDPSPSMHAMTRSLGPPRTSYFEDVIYWTKAMTRQDIKTLPQNPRMLGMKMLSMVCAEWLSLTKYIPTRLAQIEWELENPNYRFSTDGLDASLRKLHPWRRVIPVYQAMLSETLEKVFSLQESQSVTKHGLRGMRLDFERVLAQLEGFHIRTEKMVNVATAIISIEESRTAVDQNRNFARLTYLAFFFVPLSFVASFFSMTADLSLLKQTFWVYFIIAIPLTTVVLLVARYFLYLQTMVRKLHGRSPPAKKAF